MKKPERKRRWTARRRRVSHSQAAITSRMRELWSDGFGLMPGGLGESDVEKVREAMKELVRDGAYWNGLKQLVILKQRVYSLTNEIKKPGFQLPE